MRLIIATYSEKSQQTAHVDLITPTLLHSCLINQRKLATDKTLQIILGQEKKTVHCIFEEKKMWKS